MPRDYAKYKPQTQQQRVAQGWHKRLLLIVVLICITSVLVYGVYLYKQNGTGPLQQKMSVWITKVRAYINHKKTDTLPPANPSVQKAKQETEIRFNFYNELPNMQVTLPETEEAVPAPTTKAVAKETKKEGNRPEQANQYIVQLGIFKNEAAAGQMRVSLLLAGFEADTVTSPDENNTVLYRVQKGPYATLAQAKAVQKQLQKKGVAGLIKSSP